jgi:hypothetical protein
MGAFDWSQNDDRWKNDLLGHSNFYHMGIYAGNTDVAAGCYVSALATAASYLGHEITAGEMNALLTQRGLLDTNGDIVYNDTLNRLYDDIQFIERRDWPNDPAPLAFFDIRADLSTEIIVLIDTRPAPGIQQHWLRVVGWDGKNDIIVVDPWDGVRKGLSAYANKEGTTVPKIVYAAIKYRKRSIVAAPAPVTNPNPQPALPPTAPEPVVQPPGPASAPAAPATQAGGQNTPPAAAAQPVTPLAPVGAPFIDTLPAAPAPGTAKGQQPAISAVSSSAAAELPSRKLNPRVYSILFSIMFVGLPLFTKWAQDNGLDPMVLRVCTDLVAIAALVVAGYAYHIGDHGTASIIIATVVSWYFGHRTAQIQQERKS